MIQENLVNGELPKAIIVKLVTEHKVNHYLQNMDYYRGENPVIRDRLRKVIDAPHYKIPVSYARKIIKTVVGYMFKPGLITYDYGDDAYQARMEEILRINNEDTKTSSMGRQMSIQGIGYEMHYVLDDKIPRFAKIDADKMIAVYDTSIEPELIAGIWVRRLREDGRNVDVLYADRIDKFFLKDAHGQEREADLVLLDSEPHEYGDVPLNVYENNEEQVGDFDPVKALIDAYDVLVSDSMNEFDRFAWAYLVLKNISMDKEQAKDIKVQRIIELFDTGDAKFLQKDIPSQYIQFMAEWIRKEIHKQTHVPDFTDTTLGTEMTGAAIDRLFYDFEFVAADKEDRFRDALRRRFELINTIMKKTSIGSGGIVESYDIKIMMDRNKPQMLKEMAETASLYRGLVSNETLLTNFAPFVEDVEEELGKVEEEGSPYRGIDADQGSTDERADNEAPAPEAG